MHCEQIEPALPLLALDELDGVRKAGVVAHLAGCPACRAKFADLRATLDLLNEAATRLPEAKLSLERRAALHSAIRNPKSATFNLQSAVSNLQSAFHRRAATSRPAVLAMRIAAGILVAIVGALLLLPAFSPARERARITACDSNLGQIVKGLATYTESNGDYLPYFAQSAKAGAGTDGKLREGLSEDDGAFIAEGNGRATSPTASRRVDGVASDYMDYGQTTNFRDVGPSHAVAADADGAAWSLRRSTAPMAKAAPETSAPGATPPPPRSGEDLSPALNGTGAQVAWGANHFGQWKAPLTAPKWQPALEMPEQTEERRLGGLPMARGGRSSGEDAFKPLPSLSVLYPSYADNVKVFGAPSTADKSAIFEDYDGSWSTSPGAHRDAAQPGWAAKADNGRHLRLDQNLSVQPIISADRRYTMTPATPELAPFVMQAPGESGSPDQPKASPSAVTPGYRVYNGDQRGTLGALYPQFTTAPKSFKSPSSEDSPAFAAEIMDYSRSGKTGTGGLGMLTPAKPPTAAEPTVVAEGRLMGQKETLAEQQKREQQNLAGDAAKYAREHGQTELSDQRAAATGTTVTTFTSGGEGGSDDLSVRERAGIPPGPASPASPGVAAPPSAPTNGVPLDGARIPIMNSLRLPIEERVLVPDGGTLIVGGLAPVEAADVKRAQELLVQEVKRTSQAHITAPPAGTPPLGEKSALPTDVRAFYNDKLSDVAESPGGGPAENREHGALQSAEVAARQERQRLDQRKLALIAEADAEYARKKYQSAANLAEQVIALDPGNAPARDLIEDARMKLRRATWDSVIETDKKATEDERVRLRTKAQFPAAIVQYPAKEVWEDIKARLNVEAGAGKPAEMPSADASLVGGSVYAQAAKDLLSPKSQLAHESGQNVMYFDGHVKWSGTNFASNDGHDNIYQKDGKDRSGAKPNWDAEKDADVWSGGQATKTGSRITGATETPATPITTPPPAMPEPTLPQSATVPPPPSTPVEEAAQAPVFKAGPVNPWRMTVTDPLSTFAVDVDTASYSIARNYIERGSLPPPASVRMEEFVNAFDYNYPAQGQGVFTVHAEAGPSPFRPDKALLKVGVQARVIGRDASKPAHFVFVVDASGSMERPDRMPLVRSALKGLLDQLGPKDRVSLVSFQTTPTLALESAPASEKERIRAAVDGLHCGGATNLHDGLKLGYQTAARHFLAGGTNRIILCSDGVANIGETEADGMLKSVDALRRQGITLTVVGCGFGSYDDSLLVKLADRGDGNYVFVGNESEAQRVFTEATSAALQAVALDAKIQVEFNPARVRRYRLIGFEKRILAAQDFRNDAVKGGTVSSGPKKSQSSTALYELELLPPPEGQDFTGEIGTVFVRYRDAETERVEEISTRMATDILQQRTARLSPRFFVAACAAEFAEILRHSEHAPHGSLQRVASVLAPAAAQLPLDANVQQLLALIQRAQALPKAQ